jgi:hypothetical protein
MSSWPQIIYDLEATDHGEPLGVRVDCQRPQSHELQVKVGGSRTSPKVQINCSLVNGELFIDVIDASRLDSDDVPCGALASVSAKLQIPHDDLMEEGLEA